MIIALQTLIFFRQSLFTAIERFFGTYYRKLSLKFIGSEESDDEESDDHVFAEYDDEKGVVFYPPVYAQRYAAVADCLMDERWCGNLEKVVDFGYHDMSFIKYLKDVPGIKHILGVDIETIPLRCSSDLLGCENYVSRRENPLQVTLYQGNAADPDYRLIGCDAVVAIEMIEHMLPHDLERLIHTVFGFIKPWVAIFTTPNGDFNVLFKSLEKNGLRRLDHMFEWTREQFHDWCSNIVARYPQYTVTCKGIGPGPPDTNHLGCCSQLALFVAKDYHKQPDLNLNSLALVAQAPSPNNLSDMTGSWESPDKLEENNMLCLPNSLSLVSVESYTELLLNQHSCMTIVITSPTFSLESMEYKDKILQCNLESELGRNFLMFEDEVYFNILAPSRKKYCRVYEIEDVASRLNCSTIQVKKFSKVTQNLMAKNKIDTIAHTRDVVDEIRHLTKMLNFKKEHMNIDVRSTWCNINWGMNAPYWNQYYRIVREYNYPFEVKTDECRILDLITEEISKQIDTVCEDNIASDKHKLELPMDHLMRVVEDITTDEDKVKELLEWNGYEIVNGTLIYSRLIVDNLSQCTQDDWQDDTMSDWEPTDGLSSSISSSTIVPVIYDHCLRRALDQKVRKLRNLLSADEDITIELDRVVCRLMKLALHTSKGSKDPPPISWMQWKLFDLLSLTENAINRRRRLLLDNTYSVKAIDYCKEESDNKDIVAIDQVGTDSTAQRIMSEYQHFDPTSGLIGRHSQRYQSEDFEFDDYKSASSNEFREYDSNINEKSMKDVIENDISDIQNTEKKEAHVLTSTHSELVVYPNRWNSSCLIGSEESTCSTSDGVESKQDKSKENKNTNYVINYSDSFTRTGNKMIKIKSKMHLKSKHNLKFSRTKIHKSVSTKKSSYFNLIKLDYTEYKKYKCKERKKHKQYLHLQFTPPRPIPSTLIEFCHPQSNLKEHHPRIYDNNENKLNQLFHNIAASEDSMFIGIVTEDGEETIAMRRNIGTDPDIDLSVLENMGIMETEINVTNEVLYGKPYMEIEAVHSETIFLYDLNEPSTSKGVRHLSADVQCGPDDLTTQGTMSSAATSFMKMPKLFTTGIKIEDHLINIQKNKNTYDFGTCTDCSDKIETSCIKSIGIKIKDSDGSINNKIDCYTATGEIENKSDIPSKICTFESVPETKLLKHVSSALKIEDSGSEFWCSVGSFPKSTSQFVTPSKDTNDLPIQSISNEKNVVLKISQASYDRPILVCGGIHVHSFREKQVSEDVVYQGEWQRKQNFLKKTARNPISRNNISAPKNKKINLRETVAFPETKKISRKTPFANDKKQEPAIKPVQNKKKSMAKPVNSNIMDERNNVMVASKITVCSHIPKSMKTIYTSKKCMSVINKDIFAKKEGENKRIKNYLPLYLRKKLNSSVLFEGGKTEHKINLKKKAPIPLTGSINANELTKELIKIPETIINNNYVIFRNEIDAEKDPTNIQSQFTPGSNKNENSQSPQSQPSSTCSSPNSVATVRLVSTKNKTICTRRNSTSSDRSSSGILESENKTTKNKKFSRRVKNNKKPPQNILSPCDNKENIPESSKNSISSNKEVRKDLEKTGKYVCLGRTKSVFITQMTTESSSLSPMSNTIPKTKMQYITNSPKLTTINNNDEPNIEHSDVPVLKSATFNNSAIVHFKNTDATDICSTCGTENNVYQTLNKSDSMETNSREISNEVHVSSNKSIHGSRSSIMCTIRELIENKLNLAKNNTYDSNNSDSETVILSKDDTYVDNGDESLVPLSFNTLINQESCESENDADKSQINFTDIIAESDSGPDSITFQSPDTESDLLSLKSFLSISASKFSEYYLADNELERTLPQVDVLNSNSVQDIFERKEPLVANVGGVLALQAFSGFSVNEPIAGDQPDYVNCIDSETGSYTFESARQVASEEIFVSGRSSDTYESCYFDDNPFVPNWLFNIISHQGSAEESEVDEFNLPLAIPEPSFDMNGNVMGAEVGVGAGAGDGRGIHSDHSQDSSGRGTSLSSSATSSGPQSEAHLIDPSTFTSQADYLRVSPLNVPVIGPNPRLEDPPVPHVEERNGVDSGYGSNNQHRTGRNATNPSMIASDIDADVSSLDTDVVDSDN